MLPVIVYLAWSTNSKSCACQIKILVYRTRTPFSASWMVLLSTVTLTVFFETAACVETAALLKDCVEAWLWNTVLEIALKTEHFIHVYCCLREVAELNALKNKDWYHTCILVLLLRWMRWKLETDISHGDNALILQASTWIECVDLTSKYLNRRLLKTDVCYLKTIAADWSHDMLLLQWPSWRLTLPIAWRLLRIMTHIASDWYILY